MSTCGKLLEWLRYFGFYSTQAPHTYSVSQPLPSHVSLSWSRQPKITKIDVYRHRLEISLLLCCQHVANCLNDWGILDSTPQPLPSNVYFWNNRHAQIAHIQVYTHGLEISLVSCTQLHIITRPALAASQNHYHLLCMCVAIGSQQSLKGSFVHMESLTAKAYFADPALGANYSL